VNDRVGRAETRWQYTLAPSANGTVLTEAFEFLWCTLANRAVEMFVPRGRQMDRGIEETLGRIKRAAEA
ncbi:MAG: SRPBCC family protein, partial [Terriglobia bacterium]